MLRPLALKPGPLRCPPAKLPSRRRLQRSWSPPPMPCDATQPVATLTPNRRLAVCILEPPTVMVVRRQSCGHDDVAVNAKLIQPWSERDELCINQQ